MQKQLALIAFLVCTPAAMAGPQYFVDTAGNYLGAFDGVPQADIQRKLPSGFIEVPSAPLDARQKWSGSKWDARIKSDKEAADDQMVSTLRAKADAGTLTVDDIADAIKAGLIQIGR